VQTATTTIRGVIYQNLITMKLSNAISGNAVTLAAAQNTYKQNVITVNTMITSVLSSSLPTLQTNPPDWNDFVTAYVQANSDALGWVNNVMARLLQVPTDVQNYNSVITTILQDAQNQANALIQNPNNTIALAVLNMDLTNLSVQINNVVTFISGAVTSIQKFQNTLPNMATQLQTIATKSANDAKADQAQINQLLSDIQSLQNEISSLTAQIVGLAIADGIALTIGVVTTIALWPVGALVWFVMGPAVAVATYYIAMDGIQITADKNKIASDQSQITGLTADVATLNVLAQNYSQMATQATAIETNLQAILNEWLTLESDINAAIVDIRTAMADTNSKNFTAVANDLSDAVTEWNAAYTQAGALYLDLNVNNAQLQIGMSSSQVQSKLATGSTVNILQYYNNLQAQALHAA
jgi:phage host-nuclease inhibitor protein Gam